MDLQVIDRRPPLSAALAQAKGSREGLPPKWRDDMAAMAAEVARKYFGALTEDAVRDGVDATVNLLSIGLLRSTSGGIDPQAWLLTMRTAGVRGLSKLAVELIKTCDALPDYAAIFTGRDEFRPSLLMQVLSHAAQAGAPRAYSYLLRETADREEVKRSIDLAEWLLTNTSSGRVAKRDLERFFGSDTPEAEVVIHHVLTRSCGIPAADPYAEPSGDEDDLPEMVPDSLPISRLPPRRRAEARQRYEELQAKIPEELHPALFSQGLSWFDHYVLPLAKVTKMKAD